MEPRKTAWTGGAGTDDDACREADDAYREAFDMFLSGTDEKATVHAYLRQLVDRLPARRTLLDIGAAQGTTTRYLAPYFERIVCVEPSEPMRRALARECPQAEVVAEPVGEARVDARADLALLSHVLYYIPRTRWAVTTARVMEWLAPGGVLLVLLQTPDNACMRMVRHFTGHHFDVRDLVGELATLPPGLVGRTELETVPARYHGRDLEETLRVVGFLLSVPGAPSPTREAVEAYVRRHFDNEDGTYTIRHDQHVLRIERPAS
ncbi:class I SAM-dependent DNA methyltransferase [Streptomyces achromogenes]|uniref:class I SAM-dependent DNA methyltransferase n=1 Tax=Streptomyces achromogenes TaxID=67255 RepID=UPI0036FAFCEC